MYFTILEKKSKKVVKCNTEAKDIKTNKKMKKIIFIVFSVITFYCSGQEKIFLTTGDSLMGTVTKIDDNHSRITKSDGTSIMILSNMIKKGSVSPSIKFEKESSQTKETDSQEEKHRLIIGCMGHLLGQIYTELKS